MRVQTQQKRSRNQFKAWLIFRLKQAGAKLPDNPSYYALMRAVDRYIPNGGAR